ncbi:MAG: lipase family protein [Chitinispirillaceae bacterium]|nr:lipase family protein [Chitinispirillaceae bacterium]
MNIIAQMWLHAEMCSHTPNGSEELFADSIFIPMENSLDFGYYAEYDNRIIICFQGTKNPAAWVSDFDVYPLRSDYHISDGYWGKGTICDGFYTGWSAFKPVITSLIRNSDPIKNKEGKWGYKPIFNAGHSRGGTLSILSARHIAKNLNIPCSCVASGSPAPGNKELRDEIDGLPINLTRVVKGYDIVTTLPPKSFGFRQPGKLLWLPAKKITRVFKFIRIKHHFYSEYTKSLIDYCVKSGDDHGYQEMLKILPNVKI